MSLIGQQKLSQRHSVSTLSAQGQFRPKMKSKKRSLVSGLTLTSLVDCFTILVVYLLVTTTFGTDQIDLPKDLDLPKAQWSDDAKSGATLRISGDNILVNDQIVPASDLAKHLADLKNQTQSDVIILQADRKLDFARINPMVLSSLQAGFSKVQFAVLFEDKK